MAMLAPFVTCWFSSGLEWSLSSSPTPTPRPQPTYTSNPSFLPAKDLPLLFSFPATEMMQQTSTSNTLPPSAPPSPPKEKSGPRLPPSPEELVAHYESQGLDYKEASLKVIGDLQAVLYRTVASGRGKKNRFMGDTARKLDNVATRLAILEMKLDSKPGYLESLAIGVASGAVLKGVGAGWPHLVGALGSIWGAVRSATSGGPPSPSPSSSS